jgi:protein-tyrosine phosphatase
LRVLFVCSGNICRSPVAEGLLLHLISPAERGSFSASSAGTLGIVGEPADPDAIRAASERGFDISAHRSSALTIERIRPSGIVLVMEESHLQAVRALSPDHPRVRLLGSHLPASWRSSGGAEIPDPIGSGIQAFRECLRRIEKALEGFLADWRRGQGSDASPEGSEDAEQAYFREIERAILAARGGGAGLSSLEFHVADGWWRRGLPLWLVLEGLTEAASAWPAGEAPRGFLRRAEADVESRASDAGYQSPGIDPAGPTQETRASGQRERALAALSSALLRLGAAHPEIRDAIEGARGRLRSSPGGAPMETGLLTAVRASLCAAARSSLPMGAIQSIEREERERLLSLSARLTEEAHREALRRLIDDRLLEWFDLPSLDPGQITHH